MRAAVLGTGAWGTVFAQVLADAGTDVVMWGRNRVVIDQIAGEHRNERSVPGIALPREITATRDLDDAVAGADAVVIALPSQVAREVLAPLAGRLGDPVFAVSLMKGVELGSGEIMSQVVAESLRLDAGRVAVVSGPNLSGEIAQRQPTATVVACLDDAVAATAASMCASHYFRPYTSRDVIGVELCGAVKNIIALAVGIGEGQGFGHNTRATLITRGLAELTRLGVALGASLETFAGLAGIGDLAATCASPESRNRSLGERIGRGMTLAEAVDATGGTAEGAISCRSVAQLAGRCGVEVPITNAVVSVLYEGVDPASMALTLMTRQLRRE